MQTLKKLVRSPIFWLFILNCTLLLPMLLFPSLHAINPSDESWYVQEGRLLCDYGIIPAYAKRPLLSVIYAILYIPFQHTYFWLVHCCGVARLLYFICIWIGLYCAAKRFQSMFPVFLPVSLLLAIPSFAIITTNPSDALFVIFQIFAFCFAVSYLSGDKRISRIVLISSLLTISSLARTESLLLWGLLFLFMIFSEHISKKTIRIITAYIMPLFLIIGGYYAIFMFKYQGKPPERIGLMDRLYWNFETNQAWTMSKSIPMGTEPPYLESRKEAIRLFGTREQNKSSIFLALKRNPAAYIHRTKCFLNLLPEMIFNHYGGWASIPLLLFALRGIIALCRKRIYRLLALLLLWPSYFIANILISSRPTQVLLPFFIVVILSSIGLRATTASLHRTKELACWLIVFMSLALYGIVHQQYDCFHMALVFLATIIILRCTQNAWLNEKMRDTITPLFFVFMIFSCVTPGYHNISFRQKLGLFPEEKAIIYLRQHSRPEDNVAGTTYRDMWIAKRNTIDMVLVPPLETPERLQQWLQENKVKFIYFDWGLQNLQPENCKLIQQLIGKTFEVEFESDNKNVTILRVKNQT